MIGWWIGYIINLMGVSMTESKQRSEREQTGEQTELSSIGASGLGLHAPHELRAWTAMRHVHGGVVFGRQCVGAHACVVAGCCPAACAACDDHALHSSKKLT